MRIKLMLLAVSMIIVAYPATVIAGDAIERGKALFESGEFTAAAESFQAIVDTDDGNHVAYAYLGRIAIHDEDLDAAIDHLKRAVELDESNSMHRTWLGRAYIAKLQTVSFMEKGILSGRALEQLEKAVNLDPANVEARITLGGYYLNAPSIAGGSKKKALEQAQEVVKHNPVQGNAMIARVHIKNEEYDQAIPKLQACIEAQPESIEYRYHLGMVYQGLERYDETSEVFEEVLDIDADDRGALYQIGRTAALSGTNTDRGIECLERYMSLEIKPGYPDHAGAHWRLGMIFEHKADAARARTAYETAVRLSPDSEEYRDALKNLDAD